jgi:hypothetical protein
MGTNALRNVGIHLPYPKLPARPRGCPRYWTAMRHSPRTVPISPNSNDISSSRKPLILLALAKSFGINGTVPKYPRVSR